MYRWVLAAVATVCILLAAGGFDLMTKGGSSKFVTGLVFGVPFAFVAALLVGEVFRREGADTRGYDAVVRIAGAVAAVLIGVVETAAAPPVGSPIDTTIAVIAYVLAIALAWSAARAVKKATSDH